MSYGSISAILPEAQERSMDFQNGVVAGWNACAVDVSLEAEELHIDTGKQHPDFYAGWLAGYRAFMEKHHG